MLPSAREGPKRPTVILQITIQFSVMKTLFLTLCFFCLSFIGLKAETTTGSDSQDVFTEQAMQDCTYTADVPIEVTDWKSAMIAHAHKNYPQFSETWIDQHTTAFSTWTDNTEHQHGRIVFVDENGDPVEVEAIGDNDCPLVFLCLENL